MSKKQQYDWSDIKNMTFPDVKIDATDPNNLSKRIAGERETRKKLLTHARLVGCEKDMLLLFAKFDKLMRTCTNEKERSDMSQLACVEVYRLLGGGGELYVNGQLVCKDN
jgi:hypothetical protein